MPVSFLDFLDPERERDRQRERERGRGRERDRDREREEREAGTEGEEGFIFKMVKFLFKIKNRRKN